jgi:hypothetical protein
MPFSLQFRFQSCPRYPFVGQIFDLEIWLVNDSSGKLRQPALQPDEIPFALQLKLDGDQNTSHYDHLFEVVSGIRKIHSNGKCQLKVKFLDVSASYGDAKFQFVAKPLVNEQNYIRQGISTPMACIRHRLVVENRTQLPSLWYKDKGGKQNCIEIVVKLSDEKGLAVRRPIPLKLQLCYSTGEIVNRQNILEISRDSRLQINEDGFATLRVRINEVSMRHDGRTFSFCVSPDIMKDPNSADISPITCSHVEVRSKKTLPKKRDAEEMENATPSSSSRNLFPPSASPIYPHNLNIHRCPQPNNRRSDDDEESPLKKKRISWSSASPLTSTPTSTSSTTTSELTDDLIQWTMSALETLKQIKWTETGHEKITERTCEGSSVEISRPVFSISNPNNLINELLSSYEQLSHAHPQLPAVTPSPSLSPNTGTTTSVTTLPEGPVAASASEDSTQFDNLPPLDFNFPENSLSWGIVDSIFTGGTG